MTDARIARAVAEARASVPAESDLIGVGWATVELERAAVELGVETTAADPDVALGARCRVARLQDGPVLMLLEPSTEGRLAASLARLGEGPSVTWWAVGAIGGLPVYPSTDGPFGESSLVRSDPRDGHLRFLCVRRPATISP